MLRGQSIIHPSAVEFSGQADTGERGPSGYRESVELRLRQAAAPLADLIDGALTRPTADGRLSVRPPASTAERLPMAAVVTPFCEHVRGELEVVRLRGLDAAVELLQYPRTLGWGSQEPVRRDLHVFAQLADQVPVYRAHVPWGPPFQPDIGARLLTEISPVGSDGQAAEA